MSKFLNPSEKYAVKQTVYFAEMWGYGNLIDRLHCAWALKTLREYPQWGISDCAFHAHMTDKERIKRWSKMNREDLIKELADYVAE